MGGRKQKPTAVHLANGNPSKKNLKVQIEREPKYKVEAPVMPLTLSADAQREWQLIVPIMSEAKVLTSADITALVGYCECVALWNKATKELSESSLTVTTMSGVGKNPLIGIVDTCTKNMLRYLTEFGLTPASRTKVVAQPAKAESDNFEDFQKMRNEEREKRRGEIRKIAGSD